jgi:repressor LexA
MKTKKLDIKSISRKIAIFYKAQKRMPSYKEIAEILGYKSKSAAQYAINKLIDNGFLEKDSKGKLIAKKPLLSYPLLGSVKAGFPSAAEEELQDNISFDNFLISKPEATYLVTVSGDSMIEAGIMPGDIVVVERGLTPKNGDIVIAQVDGEWTMKYFEKIGQEVKLIPANKNYPVITPQKELSIGGVVVSTVRKYK